MSKSPSTYRIPLSGEDDGEGSSLPRDMGASSFQEPFLPSFSAPSAAGPSTSAGASSGMALYLTEAGDAGAISLSDIHQGQLGDCYLLSSIGEIALTKPSFISNMIKDNGNGTQTVTLYEDARGTAVGWATRAFKAVQVTVSDVFSSASVNNGKAQDTVGGLKEIWPQVLEKADAMLGGGYSSIANGGSPVLAMEALTGHAATAMSPKSLTLVMLLAFQKAGDLVTMDTYGSGALPNNLVNGHAYMFTGVTGAGASAMVHLANPWGTYQPSAISFAQLSKGVAEVDVGHA